MLIGQLKIVGGAYNVQKLYDQYVWVPVLLEEGESFEEKYPRTLFANNEPTTGLSTSYTEPYANGYEQEKEDYQDMIDSVNQYGGFYVGRYEAGCETQRTNSNKTTEQEVVLRQGVYIYNWVAWGAAMNDIGPADGVTGAVALSKKLSDGETNYKTNLMFGINWDMIMRFVADEEHNVNDSNTWGNYANATGDAATNAGRDNMNFTTGRNEAWKAKNIYDLAGSLGEWTMEANSSNTRAMRGGACFRNSNQFPASYRINYTPNNSDNQYRTFRPILYVLK